MSVLVDAVKKRARPEHKVGGRLSKLLDELSSWRRKSLVTTPPPLPEPSAIGSPVAAISTT